MSKFCIGNAFCAGGEAADALSHLLSSYLSGFKSGSIPLMDDTSAEQSTLPAAYLRAPTGGDDTYSVFDRGCYHMIARPYLR